MNTTRIAKFSLILPRLLLPVIVFIFTASCKPPAICNPGEMGSQCGMIQSFLQGIIGTSTGAVLSYTVGGTVSGLTGTGLVLTNNDGDALTIAAGATSFTFKTAIPNGASYAVQVSVSPSSPLQACSITGNTGTINGANITNVDVVCGNAVGGYVSGLYGGTLIIQNNGGDNLTLTGNGPFVFATPLASATAINVTVLTQASPQTCRVDVDNSSVASTGSPAVTMPAGNFLQVAVVCGPVSLRVADTGQTLCYNAATSISCGDPLFPRQDGEFANIPLARSFTGPAQHGTFTFDYTTTDNVTGLVWKSCSEGQSGATCATGAATIVPWIAAGSACYNLNGANSGGGYAGRKDWRLPTIEELRSLANYGVSNPAIDIALFPATVATGVYWSASTSGLSAGVWLSGLGLSQISVKTNSNSVRCVSGGNGSAPAFIDNGDGTITDQKTNLIWQKCSMGQNNDGTCSGTATAATSWANALTYCNGLSLAGKTWRLPSINELNSIVDATKSSPSINIASFPGTIVANSYWASTTAAPSNNSAWNVAFVDGSDSSNNKTTATYYVRCVSGP